MELLTTFLDRLPFYTSRGVGYPELLPSPTCQEPLDVSNNFTFELIDGIFLGESESTFAKAFLKKRYTDTLDRLRVESKSTLPSSLPDQHIAHFGNLLQIGRKGSAECRELSQGKLRLKGAGNWYWLDFEPTFRGRVDRQAPSAVSFLLLSSSFAIPLEATAELVTALLKSASVFLLTRLSWGDVTAQTGTLSLDR
jgi:hypothetical protein